MLLKHSGTGEAPSAVPQAAFDESPITVALEDHTSLNNSKTCCMSFADNLNAFEGQSVYISSGAKPILNFESPSTL